MDPLVASMLAEQLPASIAENYRIAAAAYAPNAKPVPATVIDAQPVTAPVVNAQSVSTPVIDAQPVAAVQAQPNRIPRPRNSWILYRQDKSRELRSVDPTLTAGEICKSSAFFHDKIPTDKSAIMVSKMWKKENVGIRSKYVAMAAKEDAEHKLRYPDYRYNATRTANRRANLANKKLLSAHELHTGKLGEAIIPVGCDLDSLFSRS